MCRPSVGYYVYRGRRYQKMTFFQKTNLRLGLQFCSGRSAGYIAAAKAGHRPVLLTALLLIAQAAYRVVQAFTKSNYNSSARGATACIS